MFLIETTFDNIKSESADKKLYLSGIFMGSEQKNRNGRTYRRNELTEQVNRVNEAAQNNHHILGEMDHPPSLTVSLKNVSHKIVEMHMEGNDAVGKAEILPTPMGNIARSLIESDIIIGMSTRGTGDVDDETGIVDNFNLVTIDLVCNPSHQTAYPVALLEQLDSYRRGDLVNDLAEAVIHDRKAQKYFAKEIKKFIESLKG